MTISHSLKSEQHYKVISDTLKVQGSDNVSLGLHAEMWWYEQGNDIPERDTDGWQEMYEQWATWAFKDL